MSVETAEGDFGFAERPDVFVPGMRQTFVEFEGGFDAAVDDYIAERQSVVMKDVDVEYLNLTGEFFVDQNFGGQ